MGGGAEAWHGGGLLLPVSAVARRTVERDRLLRSMLEVAVCVCMQGGGMGRA